LSETVTIPEKIVERKIIVYKSRFDLNAIRLTAEKMKTELFTKFMFLKPKPKGVRIVSLDKYYEPYVVVDGKYTIDYSKKCVHTIEVDETMQEITFFGKKFRPEPLKNHPEIHCKVIKLTGEGRFRYANKIHIIFDRWWREVGIEQLPYVPFEEQPEKILKKLDKKFGNVEIPAEKEIEIVRSRIAQRPSDIAHVHKELFMVSERAVIYKPMYKLTFQNVKTGEEATVIVDAVTGQTLKN
jgi:hypothetical protein